MTPRGPARSLDLMQPAITAEVDRLWPGESIEQRGLSLSEEVGEVNRAILKRGIGHRGTTEEWTANLRLELGQLVGVAASIAEAEGFSLAEAVEDALEALRGMERQ